MHRLCLVLFLILGSASASAAGLTCSQAANEYATKIVPVFKQAVDMMAKDNSDDYLEACAQAGDLLSDLEDATPKDCKQLWDEFAKADDFLENGDCSPF